MANKLARPVLGFSALGVLGVLVLGGIANVAPDGRLRGTGDLGVVVERASGRIQVIETTGRTSLGAVEGLGDLSHASVVFSRDERYAFVFGRDGALSKVDLITREIVGRVRQAGNSIGGAISDDGTLVAASNYEPGGVRIFRSSDLAPVAEIPALGADGAPSKVVGLVDAPGRRFVFSLYDANEIWVADLADPRHPEITKFRDAGRLPYDGLVTPDGRYYLAGLFGEDAVSLLDLWNLEGGVRRILTGYRDMTERLPVFKMPHLEGWAEAQGSLYLPAVGHHEVLVLDRRDWRLTGRIAVQGQPVFVEARPDGRQLWVSFAHPGNDVVEVIDTVLGEVVARVTPGEAVLHMAFTPRGEAVLISARDSNRVSVYDTRTLERLAVIEAEKPSGIFLAARAHRTGL